MRTYSNLLATFLLGGIWHGAGWTFVFWGLLHGSALVIHRMFSSLHVKIPKVLAWFITFNFINITWVFFRANSFDDALKVLDAMFFGSLVIDYHWQHTLSFMPLTFGPWLQNIYAQNDIFVWISVSLLLLLFAKNSAELSKSFKPTPWTLIWATSLLMYTLLDMNKVSEFLYFNF